MVAFTIRNAGVPVGEYLAEFVEAEERVHEKYGPGILFKFKVCDGGEFDGREVGRTTSTDPTPKNACGKVLGWLAGVKPADNMQVDPDDFVGDRYRIIVAETDSGSTRVEHAIRVKPDGSSNPAELFEESESKEAAAAGGADSDFDAQAEDQF